MDQVKTQPVKSSARRLAGKSRASSANGESLYSDDAQRTSIREILASSLIQTKVSVNVPGDSYEREADQVAEQIVAGKSAPLISRLPAQTAVERAVKSKPEDDDKKAIRRLLQTKSKSELNKVDEEQSKKIQRKQTKKPDEEKKTVQRLALDENKGAEELIQRASEQENETTDLNAVASHALKNKGAGRPLEPNTRNRLESGLGVNFADVRVHDDSNARSAAQALNARAFTHGNDIWLGNGESQADTRLMAHEATHVVQQQSGLAQRVVQRATASGTGAGGTGLLSVDTFYLPKIKKRLISNYKNWKLERVKGMPFPRGEPDQKNSVWLKKDAIKLPSNKLLNKLDLDVSKPNDLPNSLEVMVGTKRVTLGQHHDLVEDIKIPLWNPKKEPVDKGNRFEVDHQVELQVSGWPTNTAANDLNKNLELLDRKTNGASGSDVNKAIRVSIAEALIKNGTIKAIDSDEEKKKSVHEVIKNRGASFKTVDANSNWPNKLYEPKGDSLAGNSQVWSKDDIEEGKHIDIVEPVKVLGEEGTPDKYALLLPARTEKFDDFDQDKQKSDQKISISGSKQKSILGLKITELVLNNGYKNAKKDAVVGTLDVELDPGSWQKVPKKIPAKLKIARQEKYTGYIADMPVLPKGELNGLSPIVFSHVGISNGRLTAAGKLNSSIPLLQKVPLELQLNGRDIELAYTYDADELNLPVPRLTVEDSSLSISYGSNGLGASGEALFSIEGLGSGSLGAKINSEKGFDAEGGFSFDTELFDRASLEVWYRQKAFGGRGTLGIDKPDKVRGIRSADITAAFESGKFNAAGKVIPSIPAVQEGTLNVSHSEQEGLLIAGTLLLSDKAPGLRGGSIDAQVRKSPKDEGYQVFAHGKAEPAIPGLNSAMTVDYDNGVLTARGTGDYNRGMLSGTIDVGVTNRVIGEDGKPTEQISDKMRAFGGGQVTARLSPWLQGTVGVHIQQNGELELQGEIGLPGSLQIFPRKQIDKRLLDIAVQTPIIPGIVAEIGGGLNAEAGIGPGVIDQLKVGITYNPAHEEKTRVTGDGHLNVPSNAGLRLSVRAGIGLGIPGVSVTGGLEIGGTLGLSGAAEAGVHIDWMPNKGLSIDAKASIHAEPKFKFDISGYVDAKTLLGSLYEHHWQLAAYEFGSNLRFGVDFPIHYVEGKPFDLSLADVEFTVPKVDTNELLRSLIKQIA
jgi:hypothetical protein